MQQAVVAETDLLLKDRASLQDDVDFSSERNGFPLAQLRYKTPLRENQEEPKRASPPQYEVADIFRAYGAKYRAGHALSPQQGRVMFDIERCRTEEFGTHWDVCDMCGHSEKAYCSCHNRHCPKCHGVAARIWLAQRLKDLLPVPYYHMVFTLPDEQLHPLYLYNQEVIYNLLFESAAQTLLMFGRDPRWLGARMGFFGVLHTWGQTLWLHPHVHFVVQGGGINEDGEWVRATHQSTFLFPVKALSKRFRKLFTEGLAEAYEAGRLVLPPDWKYLERPKAFNKWLKILGQKEFVVFSKAPLGGAEGVLRYVGRYTHRVAISNQRILSIGEGQIRFTYKDYKEREEHGAYEWKEMTLSAEEFIRRFLNHILPKGFHKIRHYGFLGNGKKALLDQIRWYLFLEEGIAANFGEEQDAQFSDGILCPVCRIGRLLPVVVNHRSGTIVIRNESYLRMQELWNTS